MSKGAASQLLQSVLSRKHTSGAIQEIQCCQSSTTG